MSENLKEWIKDIVLAIVIAVLILQFIMPTIVREHSMEGTLQSSDYLFVSKKSYKWFGQPERGDIIVFQSSLIRENGDNKLLVKRIIGLPGDTVEIKDGNVILNGEVLEEKYTKDGYTDGYMEKVTVPEGCLFVMGDNRQNSADSRDSRIGFVDQKTVKGKVVLRLFPLNKFGGVYKNMK